MYKKKTLLSRPFNTFQEKILLAEYLKNAKNRGFGLLKEKRQEKGLTHKELA
jgi:hypothetical protein